MRSLIEQARNALHHPDMLTGQNLMVEVVDRLNLGHFQPDLSPLVRYILEYRPHFFSLVWAAHNALMEYGTEPLRAREYKVKRYGLMQSQYRHHPEFEVYTEGRFLAAAMATAWDGEVLESHRLHFVDTVYGSFPLLAGVFEVGDFHYDGAAWVRLSLPSCVGVHMSPTAVLTGVMVVPPEYRNPLPSLSKQQEMRALGYSEQTSKIADAIESLQAWRERPMRFEILPHATNAPCGSCGGLIMLNSNGNLTCECS